MDLQGLRAMVSGESSQGLGTLGSAFQFQNQYRPPSIADGPFIVMQISCSNLLGVFKTHDEALDWAIKHCKKNIVDLIIFEAKTSVKSENKVEVTARMA